MAIRAHSTFVPRRRQLLPIAGKVYASASEKPPAQSCAPPPQKDEFRPFAKVRPTVGTVPHSPFVTEDVNKIQTSDLASARQKPMHRPLRRAPLPPPIDFADRVALLERRERILDLAEALLDLADAFRHRGGSRPWPRSWHRVPVTGF